MPNKELLGLRILVVEDNFLLAEELREVLIRRGCVVIGPASTVARAVDLASRNDLDGAVLDINLGSENCFPIAKALRGRRVPFLFLTGYNDRTVIPPAFAEAPMLAKPVDEPRLVSTARAVFG